MGNSNLYLSLAFPEDDDIPDEQENWLDAVSEEYDKSEAIIRNMAKSNSGNNEVKPNIKSNVVDNTTSEIKQTAKVVKFESMQLQIEIDNVSKTLSHKSSTSETIKTALKSMSEQLDRYKSAQRDHQMMLEEVDEKEMDLCRQMQEICLKTNLEADMKIKNINEFNESKRESGTKTDWKLERMKLPTFSGMVRDWPRFKSDFQAFVLPTIRHGSGAYVLKQCLTGQALETVFGT